MAKPPISKLKKKLDEVFSKYIRQREADYKGEVKCFTCPAKKHWKKMQCGHFQSRVHSATRWELRNTAPQCVGCNIYKQGQQFIFGKNLDKKYGEGTADEMERLAHTEFKLDRFWLEEQIEHYKKLIQ